VVLSEHVAEALEGRGRLGSRLLADAKASTEFGQSGTVGPNGLQSEAVNRPSVRVTSFSELDVESVDERAERARQQKR
jgi:hypothetical protein